MNIAIVGLGSMGKRRIRLIKNMFPNYNIIGIDSRNDRRIENSTLFSIKCYDSLDQCNEIIDCVFVCTSPLSHHKIIHDALIRGCHVFTELNLVNDGYNENMMLAEEKGLKLFLSSTFFYREEINYIKNKIDKSCHWNYIYHIGQYLPDWHPWENYKDFFLGDKRTNGCREILAIELPWLTDVFGDIEHTSVIGDKMTSLNIDYKDNFIIQLSHNNDNKGCLVIDVVSPIAVRKLERYSENKYLSWNGTPESLMEYNPITKELCSVPLSERPEHIDGYSSFVVENAYKNEIKEFFDVVFNNKVPLYGFEQDRKILKIIDMIGA